MKSEPEELFALQLKATKLTGFERELRFAPPRRWRFDFAHRGLKIAIEVDGGTWIAGRHNRGSSIEKDMEKYNAAVAHGWRVLRGTSAMVADGRLIRAVEEIIDQ